MSYKFFVYRCEDCGAVWYDPPGFELVLTPPLPLVCRLVYYRSGDGLVPCLGRVKRYAMIDADSFLVFGHHLEDS